MRRKLLSTSLNGPVHERGGEKKAEVTDAMQEGLYKTAIHARQKWEKAIEAWTSLARTIALLYEVVIYSNGGITQ